MIKYKKTSQLPDILVVLVVDIHQGHRREDNSLLLQVLITLCTDIYSTAVTKLTKWHISHEKFSKNLTIISENTADYSSTVLSY